MNRRYRPRDRSSGAGGLFRSQALADFRHVGAVAPSGIHLAEALAVVVPEGGGGPVRRILEVGAGTGAVTAALAARLAPGDTLIAVERNAAFAAHLQARVLAEPIFRRLGDGIRVLHTTVETVEENGFDAVVSALPFNNFTADEVRSHLWRLLAMLTVGGRLSFFEYLAVRRIRTLLADARERARLRGIAATLAAALDAACCPSRTVWWNLPPAVVHTISRRPTPRHDNENCHVTDCAAE